MRRTAALLIGGLLGALASTGCDDDPAAVGLSWEPGTGALLIYGTLCSDAERITGVKLLDGGSGEALWFITAQDEGTADLRFVVGTVIGGFIERAAFDGVASLPTLVRVEITATKGSRTFTVAEDYELARVASGRISAAGDSIRYDSWNQYVADEFCDTGGWF